MIRQTVSASKLATYAVELPDAKTKPMLAPSGTGFFVSSDGWFVTAAHVVTENGSSDGPIRSDVSQGWLTKEGHPGEVNGGMCQTLSLEFVDPRTDFALIKVDFAANANKAQLVGKSGFPFLQVSSRQLEDGEPVYSFGYPLATSEVVVNSPNLMIGHTGLAPRVTSAIVSATMERSQMVSSAADIRVYVLDKALNYGNSGGPIIAAETGKVHAFCSRFQPVGIRQGHLRDSQNNPITIVIPSLYGIVTSLGNPSVLQQLQSLGVPIVSD